MTLDERIAQEEARFERRARQVKRGHRSSKNRRRLRETQAMLAVLMEVKRLPVLT